ncbi:unnamed protein product [Cercospora beticola]|nr:unnamed protein product [Cercospora beticola]
MKFSLVAATLLSVIYPFALAGYCVTDGYGGDGLCYPWTSDENSGNYQMCTQTHGCKVTGNGCIFNIEYHEEDKKHRSDSNGGGRIVVERRVSGIRGMRGGGQHDKG